MNKFKEKIPGVALCFAIALPGYWLGLLFPIIGGPVIAIVAGMIISVFYKTKTVTDVGIKFTSKKVLHWAVIFLGFGLNLEVVFKTGKQSLPIIVATICISLLIAYLLNKVMKTNSRIATLVGVGSSICGGSAIAATAPIINAKEEEIAQSISIIFFFNVVAAIIFPQLGSALGLSTHSGEAFGIFAGTAVNDTSSVTACASTWDAMWSLGTQTLDKAVTVKLTRTLAIIPITLSLAIFGAEKDIKEKRSNVSIVKLFPKFILYFIIASMITTVAAAIGISPVVFAPMKLISKFLIIMAMAAIGLSTDIVDLIKTGGKPLFMGFSCWVGITCITLLMQHMLNLW